MMLVSLRAESLAPWWVVLPLALVIMITLAAHLMWIRGVSGIDESRRRIRSAGDVVMLMACPMLAYAFGIATPAHTREFALVWMACVGLLFVIVLLACVDSVNSLRLNAAARRELGQIMSGDLARTIFDPARVNPDGPDSMIETRDE